jgi:hypothetical protein
MKKTFGYILVASILASSSASASWFDWGSDDDQKQELKNRRAPVLNKSGGSLTVSMPQPDPLYPQQQMQTGIIQPTPMDFARPSYEPAPYQYPPAAPRMPERIAPQTPSYAAPIYREPLPNVAPNNSYMGQSQNFYQPPQPQFQSLGYAPPAPEAFIELPPQPVAQPYASVPQYNAPQYQAQMPNTAGQAIDSDGYPILGATPPARPAPKNLEQDERVYELKNEFNKSEDLRRPLLQQNESLASQIPVAPQNNYVPPSQAYASQPPSYQFDNKPVTIHSGDAIRATSHDMPDYSAQQAQPQQVASGPILPQNSKSVTVKSKRAGGGYVVNPTLTQTNVIPGGDGFVFDAEAAKMQGTAATLQEYQTATVAPMQQTPEYNAPAPQEQVERMPVSAPIQPAQRVTVNREPLTSAPNLPQRRMPEYNAPEEVVMPNNVYRPQQIPEIRKSIDVAESYEPVPSSFDSPLYSSTAQTKSYSQGRSATLKPSRYEKYRKSSRRFD